MTLLFPTDFTLRIGHSRRLEHLAKDGDGNVVDISGLAGDAITWRLAFNPGGPNVVEHIIGDGITITDGAAGLFEVMFSTTDSSGLTDGTVYYWETFIKIGQDKVTVAKGYVKMVQPIT
jgi:hypothetical protein